MKEAVRLVLDGVTKQMPFRNYYEQRNGRVARDIAGFCGIDYVGCDGGSYDKGSLYLVPAKTVTKRQAEILGASDDESFYGGAVEHRAHVGKAILHSTNSLKVPRFYSAEFACSVSDLVLPGITCFSRGDVAVGFEKSFNETVRLKVSEASDGHGQFLIRDTGELSTAMSTMSDREISESGVVLESNVFDGMTVSVGVLKVAGGVYGFVAKQKNDIAPEDGRNRYIGAEIYVVRDGMEGLMRDGMLMDRYGRAVMAGNSFLGRYSYFEPIFSRVSFDYLQGLNSRGEMVGGITDITGRLGGSCPAVMQGISVLRGNREVLRVLADVSLDYKPEGKYEEGEMKLYINHPTLVISARVLEESYE